jgi:hypothetical protein
MVAEMDVQARAARNSIDRPTPIRAENLRVARTSAASDQSGFEAIHQGPISFLSIAAT